MSNEPSESETIVARAIAEGDVASVEQILKSTSDNPSLPYGRNVLHYAAKNPDYKVLFWLLTEKNLASLINDPDIYDNRPLALSAYEGLINNIKILIHCGADYKIPVKIHTSIVGILRNKCKDSNLVRDYINVITKFENNEGILEELDLSTKTNANVEQLPSAKTLSSSLTSVWASVSSISSGLKNAAKSVMNPQTERVDDRRQLLGKMKKE